MIEATRSLTVNIAIERKGDTQQMLMAAQARDTHTFDRMERIIMGIGL